MSSEDVKRRLQVLEDIEAIKRLKAHYFQVLDGLSNQGIESLFTNKGVWDLGTRGKFIGRKAIKEFFCRLREALSFTIHYFVQPDIKVHYKKERVDGTCGCQPRKGMEMLYG